MVVIGDHQSSNTRHLAELCSAQCINVIWIEAAAELSGKAFDGSACIGITAGASTPGWIIKEVKNKMSEEIMEIEESFADLLEKSIKTLNNGDKVTCTVVNVTPTEIQVDLGTKHAGYISETEFSDDPSVKMAEAVKVGDTLECVVLRVNDQDGIVTLSKKKLDANKNWEEIEAAAENKTVVEGYIREENKGGVVANVKGIRVFIPASQTGLRRNEPMDGLVGTTARMQITEVNRGRRRVVGSIRAVAAEERAAKAQAIWDNIEVDKHYTGTVKSLTSYGAFVDIGGVDGMVHISELSWSRIKHPSEAVSVGDTVEVYVIKYDPERKKISLGMKDHSVSPWESFLSKYEVGDVVSVKVVKLMSYGVFAEVVPGVDGLIHISQIADHRVEKAEDELSEGQVIDVKITEINEETKRVSLSRRAVLNSADEAED
jgi:4-hydroxy-3-methylbut-2-enyl diphosphate reductase